MGKQIDANVVLLEAHGKELAAHGKALATQGKDVRQIGIRVEKLEDDIQVVAEGLQGVNERMDREFADLRALLHERTVPIEATSRHFASARRSRAPPPQATSAAATVDLFHDLSGGAGRGRPGLRGAHSRNARS